MHSELALLKCNTNQVSALLHNASENLIYFNCGFVTGWFQVEIPGRWGNVDDHPSYFSLFALVEKCFSNDSRACECSEVCACTEAPHQNLFDSSSRTENKVHNSQTHLHITVTVTNKTSLCSFYDVPCFDGYGYESDAARRCATGAVGVTAGEAFTPPV